jgi:iron(III) transport system substrate-binding protein
MRLPRPAARTPARTPEGDAEMTFATSWLRRAPFRLAAALGLLTAAASAQAADLTVYTALEADQLKTFKQAIEEANPDLNILWVRDSTGIITAKLLAEKANPKADVVMGLAATSLSCWRRRAC